MAKETNARKRRPVKLPRVLTEDQLTALLREANPRYPTGARNRAAMLLMARCGLRVSEVTGLKVKDVAADTVFVRAHDGDAELQGGAKGNRERAVPLDGQTADAIEAWRAFRKSLGIRSHTMFTTITDRDGGEVAMPERGITIEVGTKAGRPLSRQYVTSMVKRLADRAGMDRRLVSAHVLRHTAATMWLRAGFNPREVQALLGHSSMATTQRYVHVFNEDLQRKQQNLSPLAL